MLKRMQTLHGKEHSEPPVKPEGCLIHHTFLTLLCSHTHVFSHFRAFTPCRYCKFRKLGLFEEFVVKGSDIKGTKEMRASAEGVKTKAGTRAASEAEAK